MAHFHTAPCSISALNPSAGSCMEMRHWTLHSTLFAFVCSQQQQVPQEQPDSEEGEVKPVEPPVYLPVSVRDYGNGTYLATYTAPRPGKICVSVLLDAQDGSPPQEIRGSPYTATFVEKPRPRANDFAGPTVTTFIANTMNMLEKFCLRTEAGLQASCAQCCKVSTRLTVP